MKTFKTQGFILIDVDVAALNNAGKSSTSGFDNAVATKKIRKNGVVHTYVSGQAWRFWWRDTLQRQFDWNLSPVVREKKVAFTEANPIKFPDDDVFGYMRAAKAAVLDDGGSPVKTKSGKVKEEDVTVTRISPLKNSAIISVTGVQTEENWSSMARQDGDSVPYSKEEYSALMKGMFSLDLDQVGTFATYNKTGFKNLTDLLKKEALEDGANEVEDSYVKDAKGNPQKLVRLKPEVRKKRISDTLKALKVISGGAMQTSNMADVTPKFVILSTMTTGNHPFTHIVGSSELNKYNFKLNHEALKEVVDEYKEQFEGKIFIGIREGFLDKADKEKLVELANSNEKIEVTSVNKAIDSYLEAIDHLI